MVAAAWTCPLPSPVISRSLVTSGCDVAPVTTRPAGAPEALAVVAVTLSVFSSSTPDRQ